MTKVLTPFLAIITVLSTALTAVAHDATWLAAVSIPKTHASAPTLKQRVAERKAQRLQRNVPPPRLTVTKPSAPAQDRRSRTLNSTRAVQNRRKTVVREREDSPSNASLLKRRENRRTKRLANKPVPVRTQVIDAVNFERAKHGIPPLRHHTLLERAAQLHAQDMLDRNFFSFEHINPDGLDTQARIQATGYGVVNAQECRCYYEAYFGENAAKGQTTVEDVVADWMGSESHRKNILNRNYEEIGVGLIDTIWVLNFGSVKIDPMGR